MSSLCRLLTVPILSEFCIALQTNSCIITIIFFTPKEQNLYFHPGLQIITIKLSTKNMQNQEPKKEEVQMVNEVKKQEEGEEDSEWSLSSLEELKGMNLEDIHDDDGEAPMREKPNLPKIQYPEMPALTAFSPMHVVGKVAFKVGELYIVEAAPGVVVDLDTWAYDQNRGVVGFVIDVFGKVQHPFYAIQPPQAKQEKSAERNIIGETVYFPEGSKTFTEQDIQSLKAKSSVVDKDNDDSLSSQEEQMEREGISMEVRRKPHPHRHRRDSFEERIQHRSRTRNKDRRPQQQPRPPTNNQAYLQNMYQMYYHQMMNFYNGQGNLPMPPPPPPM